MQNNSLKEVPFSKDTIYDGKIIHVEKWQVICPNGHTAPREIVVHNGAAAVVPVFEDGTTLLVAQHRVAIDRVTLEIPAGKLDSIQENPMDCAVRELREETGLTAGRMTPLTSLFTTPGFCTEKISIYLAQDLRQGETNPDEDEFLGLVRLPLEEAVSRVMAGEIRDSKTICGLLMAREMLARQKNG